MGVDVDVDVAVQLLLTGFPQSTRTLDTMRRNLNAFQMVRWTDGLTQHAAPVFQA
jgi:hypothetical protein